MSILFERKWQSINVLSFSVHEMAWSCTEDENRTLLLLVLVNIKFLFEWENPDKIPRHQRFGVDIRNWNQDMHQELMY